MTEPRREHPVLWLVAHRRVPLAFLAAAIAYWLARPTAASIGWGAVAGLPGEALRIWAAGHIDKAREVTRSGPYRFVSHPLYLGSTVLAIGFAVAAHDLRAALVVVVYLAATIPATIWREEAGLRARFGGVYDAGPRSDGPSDVRRFTIARVIANQEYRTIAGYVLALALMAVRMRM